jgi:hypothetical protein
MGLEKLPTTRSEIVGMQLDFPRLQPDSPAQCPVSVSDIKKYVRAEAGKSPPEMVFGRTALVGDVQFWLWGYVDEKGRTMYVNVSRRSGGKPNVSMGSGEGLTAEQYIGLYYARWWRKSKT